MPLADFMVAQHQHQFSSLGVSLAGALGCLVGSLVAYAVGAAGGRDLLLRYGRYILMQLGAPWTNVGGVLHALHAAIVAACMVLVGLYVWRHMREVAREQTASR